MGKQTKLASPQERLELILLGIGRQQTVENLCRQAGVSRELFYRWMKLVQEAALRAGYGPTNETLGKFIRELFGQEAPKTLPDNPEFKTIVLEETARIRSRKN